MLSEGRSDEGVRQAITRVINLFSSDRRPPKPKPLTNCHQRTRPHLLHDASHQDETKKIKIKAKTKTDTQTETKTKTKTKTKTETKTNCHQRSCISSIPFFKVWIC